MIEFRRIVENGMYRAEHRLILQSFLPGTDHGSFCNTLNLSQPFSLEQPAKCIEGYHITLPLNSMERDLCLRSLHL